MGFLSLSGLTLITCLIQDSGVGSIGLGGESMWEVDDEMKEQAAEGSTSTTHTQQKHIKSTGL